MTPVVRPAEPADAVQLARLHTASFADGWDDVYFSGWLARETSFAVIAASGTGRDCEAVAFGLALAAGDDAELLTIASLPDARRSGWGRKIFRALDRAAERRGLRRWVLEVARNNAPARGLYESEGFVEIAVRKGYYPQPGGAVDAIVMARPVSGIPG